MLTPLENNFKRSLDSWFSKKFIREVDFIQKLNIQILYAAKKTIPRMLWKYFYFNITMTMLKYYRYTA